MLIKTRISHNQLQGLRVVLLGENNFWYRRPGRNQEPPTEPVSFVRIVKVVGATDARNDEPAPAVPEYYDVTLEVAEKYYPGPYGKMLPVPIGRITGALQVLGFRPEETENPAS